jgi:putative ABC transport system permease protein
MAERMKTLDAAAAFWDTPSLQTQTPSGPTAVFANFIQGSYFDILGARPLSGRLITGEDDTAPGQNPVVVISEAFWRNRLAASPAVIGSTLTLNTRPFTVVGVVDARFRDVPFENGEQPSGGHPTDVWVPASMVEVGFNAAAATARNVRLGNGVGRLSPATNQRIGFWADPLAHHLFKPIRRPLAVVLTASIVLLMIGALNVGGLLLVRQQERRRELVVRRALGASQARLIGISAVESAMLVAASLVVAAPVAAGILGVVRRTAPLAFPRLQSAGFDLTTALALGALSLVAALLVAIVAMSVVWRLGADAKPSTTRSVTTDRGAIRMQQSLVIGEVALSAALLVCGSLVVASLARLNGSDPGFKPDRLVAMELSLRSDRDRDDAAVTAFSRAVIEQASAVPGAESVALWGPGRPGRVTWIAYPLLEIDVANPNPDRVMVSRHNISPGALATVGTPIIRGREFLATDAATRPYVVVISETMAKKFWPDKDPIGERFTMVTSFTPRPWFQVIGVAKDASHRGLINSLAIPELDFYQLLDQRVERAQTLVVRSTRSPYIENYGIGEVKRTV